MLVSENCQVDCLVEKKILMLISLHVFCKLLQIHQDFTLLFGSETASRLFERWPTVFKAKVIRLAETLTSTPLLKRLLSSSREKREELDSPGRVLQNKLAMPLELKSA